MDSSVRTHSPTNQGNCRLERVICEKRKGINNPEHNLTLLISLQIVLFVPLVFNAGMMLIFTAQRSGSLMKRCSMTQLP